MENTNKKETKIPAKSKLENKSLRQKLGHPAGLPNQFVQAKLGKARRKLKSLKGEKRITNENPHQRTKSSDQTPKAKEVSDCRVQETSVVPQLLQTLLER